MKRANLFWILFGAFVTVCIAASLTSLDHIQLAHGVVVFSTNNVPNELSPNGSLALRSNGQPYIRTNDTWQALGGGGGGGDTLWTTSDTSIIPDTGGTLDTVDVSTVSFRAPNIYGASGVQPHISIDSGGDKYDFFTTSSQIQLGNTTMFMNVGGVSIFGSDGTTLLLKDPTNVKSIALTATETTVDSTLYVNGGSILTNGIVAQTNTAPANVTIGVTAPDSWVIVTNHAGLRLKIPAWKEH